MGSILWNPRRFFLADNCHQQFHCSHKPEVARAEDKSGSSHCRTSGNTKSKIFSTNSTRSIFSLIITQLDDLFFQNLPLALFFGIVRFRFYLVDPAIYSSLWNATRRAKRSPECADLAGFRFNLAESPLASQSSFSADCAVDLSAETGGR